MFLVYGHETDTPNGTRLVHVETRPVTTHFCDRDAPIVEFTARLDPDSSFWAWRTSDGAIGLICADEASFRAELVAEINGPAAGSPVRLTLRPTGRRAEDPKAFAKAA